MSDDAKDEDELLAQVAGGDMQALEALYHWMRVQVFAVALDVTGDRGTDEDVIQDTFVGVYRDTRATGPSPGPGRGC